MPNITKLERRLRRMHEPRDNKTPSHEIEITPPPISTYGVRIAGEKRWHYRSLEKIFWDIMNDEKLVRESTEQDKAAARAEKTRHKGEKHVTEKPQARVEEEERPKLVLSTIDPDVIGKAVAETLTALLHREKVSK